MTTHKPRIAAIIVGALIALIGLAIGAAGAVLLGLFGSDGTIASGSHPISTSRTALVASVDDIGDTAELADLVGEPRIRFTARAAAPTPGLFIGIGPAAQVDRYLASAPVDEVTDFEVDPFELKRTPHEGSRRPEPPASQQFWVASGAGRDTASLQWKVRDGDYRLVLMNADGSARVDVDGDVGLTLPHVARIAWVLIGVGLLLALGGIAVAIREFWRRVPPPARASGPALHSSTRSTSGGR
jgi:hypothetical protein